MALINFLCLALNSYGEATNVSISAVPDWVRLCEWNLPTNQPQGEKSEASRYLLVERQEAPQRTESFSRVIRLMENQTGVQDCGRLSFGFDPAFQELLLHRVQIHRDGISSVDAIHYVSTFRQEGHCAAVGGINVQP